MMDRLPISEAGLVRVAGVSAALGGLLWAVNVLFGEGVEGGGAISGLLSALPVMFAGGLAGMYLRYGIGSSPSAAGFAQGFVGLTLLAGGFIADATGYGVAEQLLSFGLVVLALGLVLVGFSYLKDEPMPRMNFLPLGVGMMIPLTLVLGPVQILGLAASALFGAGWVLIGAALIADASGAQKD